MKKLPLILLLTCCLLCPGARAAESTEEMVAQAKRGVVQIYTVEYRNGQLTGQGCSGTGFAVGTAGEDTNVFVTNWHVVTGMGEFDPTEAKVYIALENAALSDAAYETDLVIPCEVLYITPGNPDMAILRATVPVSGFKALPLLSGDEIMDAAHVVALGYPAVIDSFASTNGGVDDMSVTQGYVVRHAVGSEDDESLAGTKLLFFDAVISGGNSGGPLLNDAGAVVGINTYGFGREATTDYSGAVYIDYAMEALDGLGLPYTVYQAPQEAEPEQESDFPLIFAAAAGAAVLILAVVLAAVFRRRPSRTPAAGFALLGPGGQNTPVPASGLIIGRDPAQCTLCLPGDARGVSRRHCQVTVAGASLLLTDLGSSQGTYFNGQRLTPNQPVPLARGGSFSLGGPAGTAAVVYTVL